MSSIDRHFGSQIASEPRTPSPFDVIPRYTLRTLADLLNAIAEEWPQQPIGHMRTAAGHFSNYIGVPSTELSIQLVAQALPGFRQYLSGLRLKNNSTSAYKNYVALLLRLAQKLGWHQTRSMAQTEWEAVLSDLKRPRGFSMVASYAIGMDKAPSQLSDKDLASWAKL